MFTPLKTPSVTGFLIACSLSPALWSATVNIDLNSINQTIDGFGGMNAPGWIADLTEEQAHTAFGTDSGDIGLSIMRMRISPDSSRWEKQVPIAQIATGYNVKLLATPWSPPAYMKDNDSLNNGGYLKESHYWDYSNHLNSFSSYMASNGAPLYALSLANEPDYAPNYESCRWTGEQFKNFLQSQGSHMDDSVKILIAESLRFNPDYTNPVLDDSSAVQHVDIIGGHLYGNTTPFDYEKARGKGKQLWMTEHYTNTNDANDWDEAIDVAKEIHNSMVANYSAYIWWYIRRSYGLITEDGQVSKRGHIMAQYSRFIRPEYRRVNATQMPVSDVYVTAYKSPDLKTIVVVLNLSSSHKQIDFDIEGNDNLSMLTKYTTSSTLNVGYSGQTSLTNGEGTAWVNPNSVSTFVSN